MCASFRYGRNTIYLDFHTKGASTCSLSSGALLTLDRFAMCFRRGGSWVKQQEARGSTQFRLPRGKAMTHRVLSVAMIAKVCLENMVGRVRTLRIATISFYVV